MQDLEELLAPLVIPDQQPQILANFDLNMPAQPIQMEIEEQLWEHDALQLPNLNLLQDMQLVCSSIWYCCSEPCPN